MEGFRSAIQIRWSDLDPNFHLRHSVYYDWGAMCRVEFLDKYGLTGEVMTRLKFGPILFREECIFRREVRSGDKVFITLQLIKSRKDYSRWSIQHQVIKNENIVSAVLTVDGAWMSMTERKLATPPHEVADVFEQMPKAQNFEWI